MADGARLVIASDHAGYGLKEEIKGFLSTRGFTVEDVGTDCADPADYPDFAARAAALVSSGEVGRGILICGSGIGMSITANRFPGVRAALCWTSEIARLSREHNDSNILVLAARFTAAEDAKEIVTVWLETAFSREERHAGRLGKIARIEKELQGRS
jgi:ribose 5-phosphate isomerase B